VGQEWDRVAYISRLDDEPWDDRDRARTAQWTGHIESNQDDYWEEGPPGPDREWWPSADEAIAWARARAPIVLVRIGNTHYSAGEVHAEDDHDQPLPLWPPS
jgi:hypothetical protein